MLTLRPYQESGVADIRAAFGQKIPSLLYVLETGGGKTALFSHIAHGAAAKQNRVYILSHRVELVDQIADALRESHTRHSYIAAGYGYVPDWCMVCSVPTLLRRLDSVAEPALVIIDEAHHARAETWRAVLARWPKAKLLGVTATPSRPDGKPLGTIFKKMILGPAAAELIRMGYLACPKVFAPPTVDTSGLHTRMGEFVDAEAEQLMNKPSITGSALEHYRAHTDGLPALAFAVSVQHAEDIAKQFRAAGYSAMSLSGKTDRELRRQVVADFRAKRIQILASCDLFSEGFDVPGAQVGIMLNPTQSIVRFRQQRGRIMRPGEAKYIHDHVGNTLRFGLPDETPDWSLDGEEVTKKKKGPGARICPKCFAASKPTAKKCECGYVFPLKPREVETRDGELVELTREELERRRQKRVNAYEQSQANTERELAEVWRKRGMKGDLMGRARHVLAARAAKRMRSQ